MNARGTLGKQRSKYPEKNNVEIFKELLAKPQTSSFKIRLGMYSQISISPDGATGKPTSEDNHFMWNHKDLVIS